MTLFFTADTHFGDHRTINIWRCAFASVAEMDAMLVERWNAAVGPEDEIWHLGDFAQHVDDVTGLLERLHGRKHLVRGDNDPDRTLTSTGWVSVADYAEIEIGGKIGFSATIPSGAGTGSIAARSTFTVTATGA